MKDSDSSAEHDAVCHFSTSCAPVSICAQLHKIISMSYWVLFALSSLISHQIYDAQAHKLTEESITAHVGVREIVIWSTILWITGIFLLL